MTNAITAKHFSWIPQQKHHDIPSNDYSKHLTIHLNNYLINDLNDQLTHHTAYHLIHHLINYQGHLLEIIFHVVIIEHSSLVDLLDR